MTPPIDMPAKLEASLRRTRLSVLALLACCAGVIVLQGFEADEPPPDGWLTTLAVGIGLGTILLRRLASSPATLPRRSIGLLLAALVLSAALGLLGVAVAYSGDATRTGLLFTLAGGLFTIRPNRTVGPRHEAGH